MGSIRTPDQLSNMPFGRSPPLPQAALQTSKAFSFETTSETVSLISESSLSIGSTVTLENLPLKPPLGFSPPWSTEGSYNNGLLLAPSRAGRTDQSPGWSLQHSPNSDFCVTDLGDWQRDPDQRDPLGQRVPLWDTTRSATSKSQVDRSKQLFAGNPGLVCTGKLNIALCWNVMAE